MTDQPPLLDDKFRESLELLAALADRDLARHFVSPDFEPPAAPRELSETPGAIPRDGRTTYAGAEDWSARVAGDFSRAGLHQRFADSVGKEDVSRQAAVVLQGEWLSALERAWRCAGASKLTNLAHRLGRRLGQAHPSGAFAAGYRDYVAWVLKQGAEAGDATR